MRSNVVGEFRGDYLLGHYTPSDSTRFGSGALTLRLVDGGRKLGGRCLLQLSSDRRPLGIEYVWVRAEGE
jgi:hypothetical protein